MAQRLIMTINICCTTLLFDETASVVIFSRWQNGLRTLLFFYIPIQCAVYWPQSYYYYTRRGFSSLYTALDKYSEYPHKRIYHTAIWTTFRYSLDGRIVREIWFYKNGYEFESLYLEKHFARVGVYIRRTSRSSWPTLHCTEIYHSPGACPQPIRK